MGYEVGRGDVYLSRLLGCFGFGFSVMRCSLFRACLLLCLFVY